MAPPVDANVEAPPAVVVVPAPTQTLLQGLVTDADSGTALAGVSISAGGAPVTTGADGRFQLPLPIGVQAVTVSASGYFAWKRDVAVVGDSAALEVRLLKKASEVLIPPGATTTLSAGAASFSVPLGAFDDQVMGSVAYIPPTQIGASPGPVQFQDASEETHRVLGVLTVDLPSAPGVAVTVTAPVPAGSSADRLFLFRLVNGAWADPVAAKAVVNGVASFETTYTGSVAVVERAPADAFVVTSRSSNAAAEGDLLAPGAMIIPASTPVAVETPQGDVIEIPPGQEATLAMIDEPGRPAAAAPAASDPLGLRPFAIKPLQAETKRPRFPAITLPRPGNGSGFVKGVVRPPVTNTGMPQKVEVRGSAESSVLDVRGGVFQYSERPCGPGIIIIAEIAGGTAELNVPGRAPAAVPAGSRLVTCVNCGNNTASADGTCQAGPMMPGPKPDGGMGGERVPPPGATSDAGVRPPMTGAGGAGGNPGTMPPPGACAPGAACMDGNVCRGETRADGTAPTCKCDGGRFICDGGSAPRADGGLPPAMDAGPMPPPGSCNPGLACMTGSICRGENRADGTVLNCKCDAGRYICDGGSAPRPDGGTTMPPLADGGLLPPPPCKEGLACAEGTACRGEIAPDGSVMVCKCDLGKFTCAPSGPPPGGTGAGGAMGPVTGAGGSSGTLPPPPPPEACMPGLPCTDGAVCRGLPAPDGSTPVCKCDAGKFFCSTSSPTGPTGAGGMTGAPTGAGGATGTPPPPPPVDCKPGLACQQGSYCRGQAPNGSVYECKCDAGKLYCPGLTLP
jgi:hypothetical protein